MPLNGAGAGAIQRISVDRGPDGFRIEQHQVGIVANAHRTLLRKDAKYLCRIGAQHSHGLAEAHAAHSDGLASFLEASLRRTSIRVVPFLFSATSKSRLGWDFVGLIETGRFREYVDDGDTLTEEFYAQLAATEYEVRRGPGNTMQWGVPAHVGHDDLVMSAALVAALDDLDPRPRIAVGSG